IEVVKKNGKYEIVFGHRRWLAHKYLQKEKIWARVVELSKDEVLLRRATENISRSNLSPVEEGANYQTLQKEFGMTIDKISKRVGQKPGRVKRMLDIMVMPVSFQKAIHKKKLSPTVAEALWRCEDETHREYLLELAVEHGVTAAVARQWVEDNRKTKRNSTELNTEGGSEGSPMAGKPNYMTCDLCQGPEVLGDIKQMVLCKDCHRKLNDAKRVEG
ncbi:hypothetical protein LCGC14_2761330, partial [marine sediment metagenome]